MFLIKQIYFVLWIVASTIHVVHYPHLKESIMFSFILLSKKKFFDECVIFLFQLYCTSIMKYIFSVKILDSVSIWWQRVWSALIAAILPLFLASLNSWLTFLFRLELVIPWGDNKRKSKETRCKIFTSVPTLPLPKGSFIKLCWTFGKFEENAVS